MRNGAVHAGRVDAALFKRLAEILVGSKLHEAEGVELRDRVVLGLLERLAGREAGLGEFERQLGRGVRARHGAERQALQVLDALDERAVLHHDDGGVLVVRGREVEVLLAGRSDGIARHQTVHLAVQQHLLARLGQHRHELHVRVAQAPRQLLGDVDLQAIVLARVLVQVAETHDVASHAHAQRAFAGRARLVATRTAGAASERQRARKQDGGQ